MSDFIPLKLYFGKELAELLADKIEAVHSTFDSKAFIDEIAAEVEPLELKDRVSVIARTLKKHLPDNFPDAANVLVEILGPPNPSTEGMFSENYWIFPIAEFVEKYGHDHFDEALSALYEITQRSTAEFAIRPYLQHYPEQTWTLLEKWVTDASPHIRRMASEGTRPRLPWAARVPELSKNPKRSLQLLEQLKSDPSKFVRKSVANHLNDILKDHRDLGVETARKWYSSGSEESKWIVKHAMRNLIKAGDAEALQILGYRSDVQVSLDNLSFDSNKVKVGDSATLSCTITNKESTAEPLIIDYRIQFVKANGKRSPKVFKLKMATLAPGETLPINTTVKFNPIRTRTYYPGTHSAELQVNGRVLGGVDFELVT